MELEAVRHLARCALQNLEAHRRRIDDLNVYPVPDGDTGTNLTLTLRSVVEALESSSADSSAAVAKDVTRARSWAHAATRACHLLPDRAGFVDDLGKTNDVSTPGSAEPFAAPATPPTARSSVRSRERFSR